VSDPTTVTVAHQGRPFDPPVINTSAGPVIFCPNPDGGNLWLGQASPDQAAELLNFPFFLEFKGATPAPSADYAPLPDKTWTKPGIAQWALEFLDVTLDQTKTKDAMLADLKTASDAVAAASVSAPAATPDPTAPNAALAAIQAAEVALQAAEAANTPQS
jgi:hypothetical protein